MTTAAPSNQTGQRLPPPDSGAIQPPTEGAQTYIYGEEKHV